ncbi:uncharacterized protein P884DRAFT_289124 [Thermothelomyces heterothallicus CBS 202.75]|uniref:uncharacterized protein n=1 Tax=Thermothelomyces heterothallicus CBS 202.75 TaxID=1149848 RepID=UPI003743FDF2
MIDLGNFQGLERLKAASSHIHLVFGKPPLSRLSKRSLVVTHGHFAAKRHPVMRQCEARDKADAFTEKLEPPAQQIEFPSQTMTGGVGGERDDSFDGTPGSSSLSGVIRRITRIFYCNRQAERRKQPLQIRGAFLATSIMSLRDSGPWSRESSNSLVPENGKTWLGTSPGAAAVSP